MYAPENLMTIHWCFCCCSKSERAACYLSDIMLKRADVQLSHWVVMKNWGSWQDWWDTIPAGVLSLHSYRSPLFQFLYREYRFTNHKNDRSFQIFRDATCCGSEWSPCSYSHANSPSCFFLFAVLNNNKGKHESIQRTGAGNVARGT